MKQLLTIFTAFTLMFSAVPYANAGIFDFLKQDTKTFPEKVHLVGGESGLSIIDVSDNSVWMRFERGAGNVITSSVNSVVSGADGAVYAGTDSGVIKLDFANDEILKIVGQNFYSPVPCNGNGTVDFSDRNSGNFCFSDISPLFKGGSGGISHELRGYWDMNNFVIPAEAGIQSSLVEDLSTYANHATINGGVEFLADGPSGKAAQFDGVDDSLVNESFDNISGDKISVGAWIKSSDIPSTQKGIIGKWDNPAEKSFLLQTYINGNIAFSVTTSSGVELLSPSNSIAANTWYYVVGVYDGTKQYLYINGTLVSSIAQTGDINASTASLYLGRGTSIGYFSGAIDESFIAAKVLSSTEIADLYSAGLTGLRSGHVTSISNDQSSANNEGKIAYGTKNIEDEAESKTFVISNSSSVIPAKAGIHSGASDPDLVAHWNFESTHNYATEANISLLLHADGASISDSSPQNHTITANGGLASSSTKSKFGEKSMVFDGTDDYATITSSSSIGIDTSDFTVDFWVNFNNITNDQYLFDHKVDASNFWNMYLRGSDGALVTNMSNGGVAIIDSVTASGISASTWHHIAFTRKGNDFYLFIDGTQKWTINNSADMPLAAQLYIGSLSTPGSYLNGYLDEVRMMKGGALWSGSFTAPTYAYKETFDASGNGNVGSFQSGAVLTDTGAFGKSASFDGTDDYLHMGSNNPATGEFTGSNLTVSAWIKPSIVSGVQTIAIKNGPFILELREDKLRGSIYSGSWADVDGDILMQPNVWQLVSMVYDGANVSLYVNGVLDKQGAKTGNVTNSGCLTIGRSNNGGSCAGANHYFNGLIDEVSIYKSALTENELKTMYNAGKAILQSSTTSEKINTTHFDSSGNLYSATDSLLSKYSSSSLEYGNIGTLSSSADSSSSTIVKKIHPQTKLLLHGDGTGATFTGSSNSPHTITANGDASQSAAQSKFGGKSMYFDGTGDYLSIPDSDDWNFGSDDFTIDTWFKREGGLGTVQAIVGQKNAAGDVSSISFALWFNASNQLIGSIFEGTTPYSVFTPAISDTSKFYHVALTRLNDKLAIYLDGVLQDSKAIQGVTVNDSSTSLSVGRLGDYTNDYFYGYLDEVRITKGRALWMGNFTPPKLADTSKPYINALDSGQAGMTDLYVGTAFGVEKISSSTLNRPSTLSAVWLANSEGIFNELKGSTNIVTSLDYNSIDKELAVGTSDGIEGSGALTVLGNLDEVPTVTQSFDKATVSSAGLLSDIIQSIAWVLNGRKSENNTDYQQLIVAMDEGFTVVDMQNTRPVVPSNLRILGMDGNEISSGTITSSLITLKPELQDPDPNTVITVFVNFSSDALSTFVSPTLDDADSKGHPACASGTPYNACTSKVWYAQSYSGDYSKDPYKPSIVITGLKNGKDYQAQTIALDTIGNRTDPSQTEALPAANMGEDNFGGGSYQ
jgi:hypothetical protein